MARTPRRDIDALRAALTVAEAEHEARQLLKEPPNGKEKYRGNGAHDWEDVWGDGDVGTVVRLRVPGGWLYRTFGDTGVADAVVFVPLPAAIGYAV